MAAPWTSAAPHSPQRPCGRADRRVRAGHRTGLGGRRHAVLHGPGQLGEPDPGGDPDVSRRRGPDQVRDQALSARPRIGTASGRPKDLVALCSEAIVTSLPEPVLHRRRSVRIAIRLRHSAPRSLINAGVLRRCRRGARLATTHGSATWPDALRPRRAQRPGSLHSAVRVTTPSWSSSTTLRLPASEQQVEETGGPSGPPFRLRRMRRLSSALSFTQPIPGGLGSRPRVPCASRNRWFERCRFSSRAIAPVRRDVSGVRPSRMAATDRGRFSMRRRRT